MFGKSISIKYLLPIAFALASLLPLIIFTAMAFAQARHALEHEISQDIEVRSQATMAEIDRMMFERMQNVNSWSHLEIMNELRIGDVDKRLSRFLDELKSAYRGVYVEIHAVNSADQIIASSEAGKIGQHYSPPIASSELFPNQNQLPLTSAIIDPITGEVTGKLYAIFDWTTIEKILERSTGDSRSAALFNRHHERIAETRHWKNYQHSSAIIATATSQGYQGAPSLQWQLRIEQPKSIAFSPIRKLGGIFLLFLLVVAAIASLAALPIAASIAKPLRRLSAFARNFQSQPKADSVPTGGPNEVQELSVAFKQMIEDLRKSQEDLTRAAKLAVVGELAAAMSHEVRTPLGILKSSAQILMRERGLSTEGKEVCGFILSETERMNKLIDTLLDSGRVRNPELQATDLVETTERTIAMLSAQTQKKKVAITMTGESSLWSNCDREQITQVLLNLIINAMQIIKGNNGQVEIHLYADRDEAVIEVADNGPGIAPETHERIFDPFFSTRSGGIGLGLAVVRQIIEAHHGSISVSTSHLGGASFTVRLPRIKSQSK